MPTPEKLRSNAQEDLVALYLRLNGYFPTKFIVHSPVHMNIYTEIDVLAVRHPHNAEPEREIQPSPYLEPSNEQIDLLICEVKGRGQLQFNPALRNSLGAIESVLRWGGIIPQRRVPLIAQQLQALMQPANIARPDIPTVNISKKARVRAIMCSPEQRTRRNNQPWFLHGTEIFTYIWQCLRPEAPRDECAIEYDYTAWGHYEEYVRYFKERAEQGPGTMDDLYTYLEI